MFLTAPIDDLGFLAMISFPKTKRLASPSILATFITLPLLHRATKLHSLPAFPDQMTRAFVLLACLAMGGLAAPTRLSAPQVGRTAPAPVPVQLEWDFRKVTSNQQAAAQAGASTLLPALKRKSALSSTQIPQLDIMFNSWATAFNLTFSPLELNSAQLNFRNNMQVDTGYVSKLAAP